jgi:hypothetical protein
LAQAQAAEALGGKQSHVPLMGGSRKKVTRRL